MWFLPINWLIAGLWLISAIVDYADFCYLWQLKEYRLDRFRDFTSTQQGKAYWVKYRLFWRSCLAIIAYFWPINDILTIKYILIALFVVDIGYNLYKLLRHRLLHPEPTKKSIIIVLSSIVIEGALFVFAHDWTVLLLLLIVRFFIISAVVLLLKVPTRLVKNIMISKATEKLAYYRDLTVIGVTGSYGKTTVKRFLTHILSSEFSVISTPGNINTEVGIAKFILDTNFRGVHVFIVEMGAYQIGEIKLICDMVKPKIGILTAINEQHLSLFGDIKKTQQAKYELLYSLPADGLAITNSDNEYCRQMLDNIQAPAWTFGKDNEYNPTCWIKSIKSGHDEISCDCVFQDVEYSAKSKGIGEHNVMNAVPAALAAFYLGMPTEKIISAIATLPQPTKVFSYGKCTVIDDSYNSNPDGFKVALDMLNKFPSEKKRIVITRGMQELGKKSDEIHEQIGAEISFMADELVIISPNSEEALTRGKAEKYQLNILLKYEPEDLLKYIKSLKKMDAIILLENRIPELVIKELQS